MTTQSLPPLKDKMKPIIELYHKGHFLEALDSIKTLKKIYQNEPLIFNICGICYARLGKLDKAITSYERAISILPNYADAHNNLGNTLRRIGNLELAIRSLEKALTLKPNYPDAHYNLGSTFRVLGQFDAAVQSYKKLISIMPEHYEGHFFIGISFQELRQLDLAINHFKQTLAIKPDYFQAHLRLGSIFTTLGQQNKAINHYEEALTINPDLPVARHMLDAINGNTSTEPPQEYVKDLFDDYAERFDKSLVQQLGYKLPFLMKQLILKLDPSRNIFEKVIDLGCGTGLSGKELRDISNNLTGIDLSENMVAKARELDVYDSLIVGDIVDTLSSSQEKYDLFIALDVLVYIGAVKSIFSAVRNCCKKNAFFIFSVETQEEDGYSLLKSARYSHSVEYILKTAPEHFKLIESRDVKLRKEKKDWINGKLFIFQAS